MKLGAIWLSIREERGLTQLQMGKLMGVGKKTVYLWEKNKRNPGGISLMRLFYLADAIEWHKVEIIE